MKKIIIAFVAFLVSILIVFPVSATPTIYEIEKQPFEYYPVAFEYYGKLPIGVTLVSGVASAWNLTDNTDATSIVLQSTTVTIDGTRALIKIKAGTSGKRYQITSKVTLSSGYQVEDEFYMTVQEI